MKNAKRSELALRAIDPATVAQKNRLLASGVKDLSIARLDRAEPYVALDTRINGQRCIAFVALQQLIDHWLGEATLPAAQMDEEITQRFIKDAYLQQSLPTPSRYLAWEGLVGLAQTQAYDNPLLLLKGGPFDIFLPELPADFSHDGGAVHPDIPVRLQMTIGVLHLPASALVGISAGDVMRVPRQMGLARVAGVPIFSFQIDGDYLMIETTLNDEQHTVALDDRDDEGDYPVDFQTGEPASNKDLSNAGEIGCPEAPAHAASTAPLDADGQAPHFDHAPGALSVEDLPVAISFVLSRCTMRVAQLGTFQPGMTLPLEHPTPYVDVMAGSIRLARGELVRVGQDLGVELIDVFSEKTARQTETTP